VNKTAASAAELAKCILLQAYSDVLPFVTSGRCLCFSKLIQADVSEKNM